MRLPFITGIFLYPMVQNFDQGTENPLCPITNTTENPLANGIENPLNGENGTTENPFEIETFENGNESVVEEPGQDATALINCKEDDKTN